MEVAEYPGHATPLEAQMAGAGFVWDALVREHGLSPHRLGDLASFWHSDTDLGREIECVTDMRNSRALGFAAWQDTRRSFFDVFDRLRRERIVP